MKRAKVTRKKASKGEVPKTPLANVLSRKERLNAGKALRDNVPREQHGAWKPLREARETIQRRLCCQSVTLDRAREVPVF